MNAWLERTFRALYESPNYRKWFIAQTIGLAGSWVQMVAQGWLVLELTDSPTAVGVVAVFQYVPVTLLAPFMGSLVDRFDTRRVLIVSQAALGLPALIMGILTLTNAITITMVWGLAILLGIATSLDNPARQTFVSELVEPELLTNAVTLGSVNINVGRIVGPALTALIISTVGIGTCFLVNAVTYLVVVLMLTRIDRTKLQPRRSRTGNRLRDGFAYVRRTPRLLVPLLMMVAIGTLTYEFQISLPAFAKYTFDGDDRTFSLLTGAMGVGAVIGGLVTAGRPKSGFTVIVRQALLLGVSTIVVARAPNTTSAVVGLIVVGAASVTFLARANATVQLASDPDYRGRMSGLWTVAFLGSTPIGAPIIGYIAERWSPRVSLTVSGAAAIVAAGAATLWWTLKVPAAVRASDGSGGSSIPGSWRA